jgi:hypothetical protein
MVILGWVTTTVIHSQIITFCSSPQSEEIISLCSVYTVRGTNDWIVFIKSLTKLYLISTENVFHFYVCIYMYMYKKNGCFSF